MIRKKIRNEIIVIQDHQITCAQFSYNKYTPILNSVVTHDIPKDTIIDGIPFEILSLFAFFQGSTLPLSLCIFSSRIQEYYEQNSSINTKNIKNETSGPQHVYRQKIPSCCSAKKCWYIARYEYQLIMPFLLCTARAKRNLQTITFSLQSLLSLFHMTNHHSCKTIVSKQEEHTILSHIQQNTAIRSFFSTSMHYLEKNPALWYALGAACQESMVL